MQRRALVGPHLEAGVSQSLPSLEFMMTRICWLLVLVKALHAHDMWIEPATFSPVAGQIVSVKLRVGQDFLGDPLPRSSALINQFVVIDSEGRKPVVGREGGDPAGLLRVPSVGLLIVGYYSNSSTVELTAEKFNQYLKDEGLDNIAAMRVERNQTRSGVHEVFSRCAKSLLHSGASSETQSDKSLGFPLELVAEKSPYALRDGEDLTVRLTYENRPLANALIVAMNKRNPSQKLKLRTGADGRVRLRLPPGGMWMLKSVHMIPAPASTSADWQSFWASLTFGEAM